jgi:tetratricopeptide (TPR) repeat protein
LKNEKIIKAASYRHNHEFLFKVGMRYFEKKLLDAACKYINKAVNLDPSNAYYQFNLACVYSEMKEPKKSNDILFEILKIIDPTLKECYFGIAYNYFDMGNFKKAREYFEKYTFSDPEGQFVDEAYDILYYLQIYVDNTNRSVNNEKVISRLLNDAQKCLDSKEYEKACAKLERVLEINPEIIEARYNLSLANYFCGNSNKAIIVAKSILILEPDNVFAYCNLAFLYKSLENISEYKKYLNKLNNARPRNKAELFKMVETYCKFGMHSKIAKILIDFLKNEKEYFVLHMLSVALYNMSEYSDAADIWTGIKKLFPQYNIIIDYYIMINLKTSENVNLHTEMKYSFDIPSDYCNEFDKKLEAFLKLEIDELKYEWANNNLIRDIALYNLYEASEKVKTRIIEKLFQIDDNKIYELLRNVINDKSTTRIIKTTILKGLKIKGL